MTLIVHTKVNNIADWTQAELDVIIAGGAAPLPPPGTVLDDVTLASNWNDDHDVSGFLANANIWPGSQTFVNDTIFLDPLDPSAGFYSSQNNFMASVYGMWTKTSNNEIFSWTPGVSTLSLFGGAVTRAGSSVGFGINSTLATWNSPFRLVNGSAAAGTAPIYAIPATLMTTPENSAIEFLADKAYYTIPTGTARKEFTLNDAALTSSRVPFCTTNGRLTSVGGFTFGSPGALTLGAIGSTGTLKIFASAGGGPTLSSGGATNWNFVLPNGAGTAGQALLSGAGSTCTWGDVVAPTGTAAVGDILYVSAISPTVWSRRVATTAGALFTARGASTASDYDTNMLVVSGKVTRYNNVNTAGIGVVPVMGAGSFSSQTAAVATVATVTPSVDTSYRISVSILVRVATIHNFTATVSYVDAAGNGRTQTLNFQNTSGTLQSAITNAGGTMDYAGIPITIRARSGSAVTIATTGTFTTVTYDVHGTIEQLS